MRTVYVYERFKIHFALAGVGKMPLAAGNDNDRCRKQGSDPCNRCKSEPQRHVCQVSRSRFALASVANMHTPCTGQISAFQKVPPRPCEHGISHFDLDIDMRFAPRRLGRNQPPAVAPLYFTL